MHPCQLFILPSLSSFIQYFIVCDIVSFSFQQNELLLQKLIEVLPRLIVPRREIVQVLYTLMYDCWGQEKLLIVVLDQSVKSMKM